MMITDHIGIVVPSLDAGLKVWREAFGYTPMTEQVLNTRQKVRVVFLRKQGCVDIKLVEPLDPTSTVYALARRGGGLHHLCFKTESIKGSMEHLKALGATVLLPPEPGEAFENEPIAFMYLHGLPIELIATEKKARRIAPDNTPKG
jgi:methylmalonyl-CoA/ethylmalonyl-CoA epimerase